MIAILLYFVIGGLGEALALYLECKRVNWCGELGPPPFGFIFSLWPVFVIVLAFAIPFSYVYKARQKLLAKCRKYHGISEEVEEDLEEDY